MHNISYTGVLFILEFAGVQVGSVTNTFNVPGVKENCFFLKDMEGAKALRQRINECFEISALPSTTPEERRRLLTFVVVSLCLPLCEVHCKNSLQCWGGLSLQDTSCQWHRVLLYVHQL